MIEFVRDEEMERKRSRSRSAEKVEKEKERKEKEREKEKERKEEREKVIKKENQIWNMGDLSEAQKERMKKLMGVKNVRGDADVDVFSRRSRRATRRTRRWTSRSGTTSWRGSSRWRCTRSTIARTGWAIEFHIKI